VSRLVKWRDSDLQFKRLIPDLTYPAMRDTSSENIFIHLFKKNNIISVQYFLQVICTKGQSSIGGQKWIWLWPTISQEVIHRIFLKIFFKIFYFCHLAVSYLDNQSVYDVNPKNFALRNFSCHFKTISQCFLSLLRVFFSSQFFYLTYLISRD